MHRLALLAFLMIGCSGGGGGGNDPPAVDAADQAETDASADPACTMATYDRCADNADCTSGNCHLFMMDGIQVCTQACDAQNPCPQLDGQDAECNNRGICKPPGERACAPQ